MLLGINDYRFLPEAPEHPGRPDRRVLSRVWQNGPLGSEHRYIAAALWRRLRTALLRQSPEKRKSTESLAALKLLGEGERDEYRAFLALAKSQFEKEPRLKRINKSPTVIDASSPIKRAIPQFQISDITGRESQRAIIEDAVLNKYRRPLHLYHQCNEDDCSEYRNSYWTYIPIDFSMASL